MSLLIIGLALWVLAHFFKRLMPAQRAKMGNAGKGGVAAVILVSLVLIILGYRAAEFVVVWSPPGFLTHLNNLMMLGAVFLYGMSATTGRLRGKLRHPQLLAVTVWAVAHLLVNGDLASIALFGTMLIWAQAEIALINRAEPWRRPEPGPAKKDIILVVITLVMFGLIAAIHTWLGVSPFGG
ncbi:NnrU family protein [Puniceibacterium sp. IMCC21224]|uniref:NnrU family protein n=1 Tax=Puniceibacterium sp. IMCC21224 TaxID=1618204 RepID=UPI00064D81FC|nr:NnrU family protein [Puniceibacterium sp. IMCC21224]KMK66352.1 NnrU protein [Puniceibacterium sp. IMCC21224]